MKVTEQIKVPGTLICSVERSSGWLAAAAAGSALDLEEAAVRELDPPVVVEHGLSSEEARTRLAAFGPNQLAGAKKESGFRAFIRQYEDFMQVILLVAAVCGHPDLSHGTCRQTVPQA